MCVLATLRFGSTRALWRCSSAKPFPGSRAFSADLEWVFLDVTGTCWYRGDAHSCPDGSNKKKAMCKPYKACIIAGVHNYDS